jgi:hypothetical protein
MLLLVAIVASLLISFLVIAAVIDLKARRRGRQLGVEPASVLDARRRNHAYGNMYPQGGGGGDGGSGS